MADELPISPPEVTVATEAPPASQAVPANQPQPSGDRLAAILAKQARGEPLTRSEAGYLGTVKRKAKAKAVAPAASDNVLLETPQPATAPADNILFEGAASTPASNGQAVSATAGASYDKDLLRVGCESLADCIEIGSQIGVSTYANSAGCDAQTAKQYESAVALQARNRKLIVEGGEPFVLAMCKWLKCSPDQLGDKIRGSGFALGVISHSLAVAATVKSIRESAAEFSAKGKQP